MIKKENGNIIDNNGKILFFSIDNFIDYICSQNRCFICGLERTKTIFNDEHVIPRWILKRYELFDKKITLPNGKEIKYGKYKTPCCKSCNSLLGNEIEKKISEGFKGDYNESINFFNKNKKLIFIWMCLLYIKTHLNDQTFKYDFKSDKKIGDYYNWEELHHIHAMARSIYTNVNIEKSVYGSMFIYAISDAIDEGEKYDYIDLYRTGTILLRLGSFCIICVIDDSKIVSHLIKSRTKRITGKLNFLQMRELYSRVTYENLRIIDKPKYFTTTRDKDNYIGIHASINNKIKISSHNELSFGNLMYKLVKGYIFKPENPELKIKMQEQVQAVKNGQFTYLFDSQGKFLNNSAFKVEDEKLLLSNLKNGVDDFLS